MKCPEALAELRSLVMSYEQLLNSVAPEIGVNLRDLGSPTSGLLAQSTVEVLPLRPTQLLVGAPAPA